MEFKLNFFFYTGFMFPGIFIFFGKQCLNDKSVVGQGFQINK